MAERSGIARVAALADVDVCPTSPRSTSPAPLWQRGQSSPALIGRPDLSATPSLLRQASPLATNSCHGIAGVLPSEERSESDIAHEARTAAAASAIHLAALRHSQAESTRGDLGEPGWQSRSSARSSTGGSRTLAHSKSLEILAVEVPISSCLVLE